MKSCTFFGHRNTSERIEPALRSVLVDLIENHHVTSFYVGNTGQFDQMVAKNLTALKKQYPHIRFSVVLAYLPKNDLTVDPQYTLYPEGLERVPQKHAILWRNNWMLGKADYVVTHVVYTGGGAARFKAAAEKKKKIVINLT